MCLTAAGLIFVLQELLLLPDTVFQPQTAPLGAARLVREAGEMLRGGQEEEEEEEEEASQSGRAEGESAGRYKEKWQLLLDIVPDLPVAPVPEEQCRTRAVSHSDPWASPDER